MNNLLTQKFPIAALLMLLMISMSCSHEPIVEPENPGGSNVHGWEDSTINGDATMTRMVFSVNDSIQVVRQGQTRATTTVAGVTTFDLNDAVTIGITGRGTKDYKVTSILTGALTYNGTATDAYCWQSTSETVSLTAWSYGSTTTTADPDNAVYTLPTDQSVSYGELLYAAANDYDYASYKSGISLTLHHQLARLVINLTHLKTGDLDISEIYIGDGSTATVPTTAKFHKPSTGNIGTWDDIGTEKAQITPKTETANACYSAVMIPTTYAAGQKFIVLKTTDSRTYCYIPDADIVLAAGNQYNYTISVKDLKEVSTLTISDITPYTYDGTAKEPHPTVTDGSKTLTEGTDYTLSWSNNTNAGTATVTVTGMGGYYSGTQNKNFTINKAASTIVTDPTAATGLGYSTYNATTQTLLSSGGTASGGTLKYYVKTTNSTPDKSASGWTTTIPTALVADTYYVYYYVQGDANHEDTDVSTPLSINVTATRSYDIKQNPLWYMAPYNMTGDNTMASTDNAGYHYNWSTAMSKFAASTSAYSDYRNANKTISGQSAKWHLPVLGEWLSIIPCVGNNNSMHSYVTSSSTSSYKSNYITPKFGYNSTTKSGVGESSYYRYISDTEIHAIRFLGTNYCSAWKWIKSGSTVLIYATLIDVVANNATSAASWYNNHSWNGSGEHIIIFGNNDSGYAVQRSIYERGYIDEGNGANPGTAIGTQAAFWSASYNDGNNIYRLVLDAAPQYSVRMSLYKHGFNVRMFKDN